MRIVLMVCILLAAATLLAHPPVSVVIDARGNVYYSDLEQVWRVAPDGSRTVAVPNVHTHELYLNPRGELFGEHLWYNGDATKTWGHYIWKRDAAGRISLIRPRTEGFPSNYGFAHDRAGTMYWLDRERGQILKKAPNGPITRVAGELKAMRWLHATPGGTLYVVDGSDLVRVRGGRATRFVRNITTAERHTIMGIWTDGAENVYLADNKNRVVKRVTPAGVVSTFARSTFPWSPIGGAFAANGDLWVLEATSTSSVRVRRIASGVRQRQLPLSMPRR
ncbi:MAG TPA: hypothetical protein VEO54_12680 [Thermoanaerobaculia bacterium]|nr:hypothetical protein [Thermoanaerobaculia bacterium]